MEQKCYEKLREGNLPCNQSDCRKYIHHENSRNCSVLAAEDGPKTLQEIGDVFGVSRMRICQIEKSILAKLRKSKAGFDEFND